MLRPPSSADVGPWSRQRLLAAPEFGVAPAEPFQRHGGSERYGDLPPQQPVQGAAFHVQRDLQFGRDFMPASSIASPMLSPGCSRLGLAHAPVSLLSVVVHAINVHGPAALDYRNTSRQLPDTRLLQCPANPPVSAFKLCSRACADRREIPPPPDHPAGDSAGWPSRRERRACHPIPKTAEVLCA